MLKFIFKVGIPLVIVILVYNYFFGTSEEQERSKVIFTKVKDLGKEVGGLLKSEKDKFNQGKYDKALDLTDNMLQKLKEGADKGSTSIQEIKNLERKKDRLEQELDKSKSDGNVDSKENQKLTRGLDELVKEMEALAEKAAQ
jgi:hypothetical protein